MQAVARHGALLQTSSVQSPPRVVRPRFVARSYLYDLDAPLLRLSPRDPWRVRDALEGGTQIFGSPGSGKSSGSARTIAHAMLRAGWGFLVLCARNEEAATWRRYCKETGREKSLIVIDGSRERRFNFLTYELAKQPRNLTQNVVNLLTHILDAAEGRVTGDRGADPFWKTSTGELLSHSIDMLWHAYGRVTLGELVRLLAERPQYTTQVTEAAFQQSSFWSKTMERLMGLAREPAVHYMEPRIISLIFSYFARTLGAPDHQKTTGSVVHTLTASLSRLLKGTLHDLFCTTTNVVPEYCFDGAVIVVDLPVVKYHDEGILAAHIWKYLWQRAVMGRVIEKTTRPVVCWADECQFFLSSNDALFVSNSRAQRACSVYITQNLPTYYSRIVAPNPADVADSLIGNFANKIFHNNTDERTNRYASELIGKGVQLRYSQSGGTNEGISQGESFNRGGSSQWGGSSSAQGHSGSHGGGRNWGESENRGTSRGNQRGWSTQEVIDYHIQPAHFATLAKGGPQYKMRVEAIMQRGGTAFHHTGQTFIPLRFKQT
jgi:NAD(P)-dependent dehydrogenase (short-subunit alcohol dehydrogenase family)